MIGERIRERRKQLGLTQDELASMIGSKKTSISNYEINANSPPEKIIIKIMKALDCDANYLFGDCGNKIVLTPHEQKLIEAYRKMPEMQPAIDKLLDVSDIKSIKAYRAAESDNESEDKIFEPSQKYVQALKDTPESDEYL